MSHAIKKGKAHLARDTVLDGVLYVPNFHCNLISIGQLTQALNCSMTFTSTFCVIQDLTSRIPTEVGEKRDMVYRFLCVAPHSAC